MRITVKKIVATFIGLGSYFLVVNVNLNMAKIPLIAQKAQACILGQVFDNHSLHNANRNGHGPPRSAKSFTIPQLEIMVARLSTLLKRQVRSKTVTRFA